MAQDSLNIKILDYGNYNIVVYIVSLIVLLLLLWYFTRHNILLKANCGCNKDGFQPGCGCGCAKNMGRCRCGYKCGHGCRCGCCNNIDGFEAGGDTTPTTETNNDTSNVDTPPVDTPPSVDNSNTAPAVDISVNEQPSIQYTVDDQPIGLANIASNSPDDNKGPNGEYLDAGQYLFDVYNALKDSEIHPLKFERTDLGYNNKPLIQGVYGDVPIYMYNNLDSISRPKWDNPTHGVYMPNSKEAWKNLNYPIEADAWYAYESDVYDYPYFSHSNYPDHIPDRNK